MIWEDVVKDINLAKQFSKNGKKERDKGGKG